jgi:hypothetical protein
MKTRRTLSTIVFFAFCLVWTAGWQQGEGGPAGESALLAAAESPDKATTVRVIVRFAKIRSLPNASARIGKEIGYGTLLQVLGMSGDYYQVAALAAPASPEGEKWFVLRSEVENAPEVAVQALMENRRVTCTPAMPAAGQTLLFTASNFRTPSLLKWDMGDGTVLTSGGKAEPGQETTLSYSYAAPGRYVVKVYDDKGNLGLPPVTIQLTVTSHARALKINPEQPLANHPVAITALNFHTPEKIAWELGDGTEIKPGAGPGVVKASFLISHVYAEAGTYTIRAYDSAGDKKQQPLALEIKIGADPRRIRMDPAKATVGIPLQFNAVNFNTPEHLRWDMGDGTLLPAKNETGVLVGSLVNYSYKNPGDFQVKVYDWDADPGRQPVRFAISVSAAPAVAAARMPDAAPPVRNDRAVSSSTYVPARSKKYSRLKLGPYVGYFQPQEAQFKEIYGNGDVLYGAGVGVNIWRGFYFWLSVSQYKIIAQTTFTGDKTTMTMLPISAFLRYFVGQSFFQPYAGIGYTFLTFKEESPDFLGNTKGSGSSVSFEAGFELKMNRHISLDLGARFAQIKAKPENSDKKIDLGGLQAGVTLLLSF